MDRHGTLPGRKNVYIGDRGYCSYNNMAHVVEQGRYFLFRTKDIHSKGLVGNFEFPETESFDIDVRKNTMYQIRGLLGSGLKTIRKR